MSIKIKNCKIYISFIFSVLLSLAAVLDKSGYIIIGILATGIHELGHIISMFMVDRLPENIHVGLMSISIIDMHYAQRKIKEDIFILFSGPAINLIFFGICFIILKLECFSCFSQEIYVFAVSNLFAGLLNLLPIRGLDGGSIIFLILSKRCSLYKSRIILTTVSIICLIPMFFVGFLILFQSDYNFSLLIVSCCLLYTTLFKF